MRLPVLIIFLLFQQGYSHAQTVKDSLEKKYHTLLCDTSIEVADGVLEALRTKKFTEVKKFIPSIEYMQLLVDSVDSNNMLAMARIRQQYHVNKVRKEFITLMKDTKKHHVNLKTLELEERIIKPGKHDWANYAEVYLVFKKGDKRYMISFLAIELVGYWFLGDQLLFEPII